MDTAEFSVQSFNRNSIHRSINELVDKQNQIISLEYQIYNATQSGDTSSLSSLESQKQSLITHVTQEKEEGSKKIFMLK